MHRFTSSARVKIKCFYPKQTIALVSKARGTHACKVTCQTSFVFWESRGVVVLSWSWLQDGVWASLALVHHKRVPIFQPTLVEKALAWNKLYPTRRFMTILPVELAPKLPATHRGKGWDVQYPVKQRGKSTGKTSVEKIVSHYHYCSLHTAWFLKTALVDFFSSQFCSLHFTRCQQHYEVPSGNGMFLPLFFHKISKLQAWPQQGKCKTKHDLSVAAASQTRGQVYRIIWSFAKRKRGQSVEERDCICLLRVEEMWMSWVICVWTFSMAG